MRALLTVHPALSHLRAMVPVAQALRRAGHVVAVATPASIHGEVRAYGLEPLGAGAHWSDAEVAGVQSVLRRTGQPWRWAHLFLRELADPGRMADDVVALAPGWRPDAIVHDCSELGGGRAARRLGLPCVAVGTVAGGAGVLEPAGPAGRLRASMLPPEFEPADPDVRRYRPEPALRPDDRLPGWIAELPAGRPLVVVSLGTVFHGVPGRLEALLAGLAGVECAAVVAAGDPGRLPPQPPHIRVEARIPQALLLECCDLLVTHGGANSVREALSLGVPMVLAPIASDQVHLAGRCEALGIGRSLGEGDVAPAAAAAACREVLGDPAYRERARAVMRTVLALPPLDQFVSDLESLVGGE